MFLDAEGRPLLRFSGPRTPGAFEDALAEVQAFQALEKKAEAGDAKAAAEVLIRQLQLEWFALEEARRRVAALEKVSSKQKKELEQLLVDIEVRGLAKAAGANPDKRREAGEHFFGMWQDERVPATEAELASFWLLMADFAEGTRDKKLFKKIVRELDDALPNTAQKHRTVEDLERRLESL